MKPYVIKKGDYLTKLAFEKGFDKDTVWSDPKNKDLRDKRSDPDTLRPGDVIFVPDKNPKSSTLTREQSHSLSATIPKIPLRVTLSVGAQPLKDTSVVIKGMGEDQELRTDGSGVLSLEPPLDVRTVKVEIPDKRRSIKLELAGMDPGEEPSGARMRLQNLGYLGKTFEPGASPYVKHDKDALGAALQRFQGEQGLEPTGKLDDETMKTLKDVYGS